MLEHFPIIYTNIWDATIAVPVVIVITQIIKVLFKVKKVLVPTVATIVGLIVSIFFAHKNALWAGMFMGFFYGNAAVGVYASMKTTWKVYRKRFN